MLQAIEIRELEPQPVASIRTWTEPAGIAITLAQVFQDISLFLAREGLTPAGPPFARYHVLSPEYIEVEAGMPVPSPVTGKGKVSSGILPGGQAVVTWHQGSFESLRETYAQVQAWVNERGLECAPDTWEVYWTDPAQITEPAQWRTEIIWPLK